MSIDERDLPLFLGVSRSAARRPYGWDLGGLTTLVPFPFFPQWLTGLRYVVGFRRGSLGVRGTLPFRLILTDQARPANCVWADHSFSLNQEEAEAAGPIERGGPSNFPRPPESAQPGLGSDAGAALDVSLCIDVVPAPALVVWGPCRVLVEVEVEGVRYCRGRFACVFVPPPPLSNEERRAIASRPGAAKIAMLRMKCNGCGSETGYYTQLNPLDPYPADLSPAIRIEDAPSRWSCMCGYNFADLTYLKQGLHDVLRRDKPEPPDVMQYVPLYEEGRIQDIIGAYEQLIETATDEEVVQKFLEEHAVFWAFLSPDRILHKPAVLTKKKADFGILTKQGILYLVELEKPTTRLINHDGAISAEIQRGANQIRDWELVVGDHRLALLAELGLKENQVHDIRYLLIGGLARHASVTGLTKLRRAPFGRSTDFYCFDELASSLRTIVRKVEGL
jgi:hypothetical protein